jgi:hypothetical protein
LFGSSQSPTFFISSVFHSCFLLKYTLFKYILQKLSSNRNKNWFLAGQSKSTGSTLWRIMYSITYKTCKQKAYIAHMYMAHLPCTGFKNQRIKKCFKYKLWFLFRSMFCGVWVLFTTITFWKLSWLSI